ncbi:glutamate mutase L [Candidatus Bathyarchaeota archaeon]|nr:glutamate mutase L [Candidatus Bathyarchaeota archaeon]MBS7631265.1 glutamate mutase L [Candidatus Bathyarchaeota archaeon]
MEEFEYILVTDVGSTTTKARLFKNIDGDWRYVVSGEAPTTVEAPYENVIMGVQNAIREIEDLTGLEIISDEGKIIKPHSKSRGVDFYCTTSSAGGGLQMMVAGVIKTMTVESANRAALGAGAIVMDAVAVDDGRPDYEKIQRVRNLRPDMILLAGGTDGGTTELVMQIAEIIAVSDPKARLGADYKLPLVFAGNKLVRPSIKKLMEDKFALTMVDNLRPVLEVEDTEPARRAIHELFMEHVMSHAPGYPELMKWTDLDIMPTPAGEGMAMQLIASVEKKNLLGVGLGGATTNVYSVFDGRFVRSVSANLGMSYSICNVLKEAGIRNIMRWIPFNMEENILVDSLRNKMIRPTTIPQTLKSLMVEHAVAREALRLGLKHHKTIATRLKGAKLAQRMLGDVMESRLKETYIEMMKIGIIAGTGGLLSHAPLRVQSLMILTDAFQPEGITKMYQDSVFMMPHLGVLSTAFPEIAWNIFEKDCLVRLGTVVAPAGTAKPSEPVINVKLHLQDETIFEREIKFNEIVRIPLAEKMTCKAVLEPKSNFDLGGGLGKKVETTIEGGVVGVIIDARGRPLTLPEEDEERRRILLNWFKSVELYPEESLSKL